MSVDKVVVGLLEIKRRAYNVVGLLEIKRRAYNEEIHLTEDQIEALEQGIDLLMSVEFEEVEQ